MAGGTVEPRRLIELRACDKPLDGSFTKPVLGCAKRWQMARSWPASGSTLTRWLSTSGFSASSLEVTSGSGSVRVDRVARYTRTRARGRKAACGFCLAAQLSRLKCLNRSFVLATLAASDRNDRARLSRERSRNTTLHCCRQCASSALGSSKIAVAPSNSQSGPCPPLRSAIDSMPARWAASIS
jgi:hypothetical protein